MWKKKKLGPRDEVKAHATGEDEWEGLPEREAAGVKPRRGSGDSRLHRGEMVVVAGKTPEEEGGVYADAARRTREGAGCAGLNCRTL